MAHDCTPERGGGNFVPVLTNTDWNEEWKALQGARQHADDPAVWDAKAKTFPAKHGSQEGYVQRFLELAGVQPGETVFDMGCGTGALATPLARAGSRVIACDFSRGMLDKMEQDQRNLGVSGVDVHLLSWSDDWERHGIAPKCADVAIASRSIATYDLADSLRRLGSVARRRVCITLPCGLSPRCDDRLLEATGFAPSLGRDFLYAFNILAAQGIRPEVAYIPSTRMEVFESPDDALEGFTRIVKSAVQGLATPTEVEAIPRRLKAWLGNNLVHDERGWHLAEARHVTWAFMAWNL